MNSLYNKKRKKNNNLQKLYKSFKINNGYSIYGQKMTSDVGSTKMTSCTNNINSMPYPHSTNISNYQNLLSHSYQPNNNFSQKNNN